MYKSLSLFGAGNLCMGLVVPVLINAGYRDQPKIIFTNNEKWNKYPGDIVTVQLISNNSLESYEIALYREGQMDFDEFKSLLVSRNMPGLLCSPSPRTEQQFLAETGVIGTALKGGLRSGIERLSGSNVPPGTPVICFENDEILVKKLEQEYGDRLPIHKTIVHRPVTDLVHRPYENRLEVFIDPTESAITMFRNAMDYIFDPHEDSDPIRLFSVDNEEEFEHARLRKFAKNCEHFILSVFIYQDEFNNGIPITSIKQYYLKDYITPQLLEVCDIFLNIILIYDLMITTPEFIISRALFRSHDEYIVKTAQHFKEDNRRFLDNIQAQHDKLGRILEADNPQVLVTKAEKFVRGTKAMLDYLNARLNTPLMLKILELLSFKAFLLEDAEIAWEDLYCSLYQLSQPKAQIL